MVETLLIFKAIQPSLLSRVWHFATPRTEAYQAPLSVGFPSKNTQVGCHFLLKGIFPAQGSNPHLLCLLNCRYVLYHLSHCGSPFKAIEKLKKKKKVKKKKAYSMFNCLCGSLYLLRFSIFSWINTSLILKVIGYFGEFFKSLFWIFH